MEHQRAANGQSEVARVDLIIIAGDRERLRGLAVDGDRIRHGEASQVNIARVLYGNLVLYRLAGSEVLPCILRVRYRLLYRPSRVVHRSFHSIGGLGDTADGDGGLVAQRGVHAGQGILRDLCRDRDRAGGVGRNVFQHPGERLTVLAHRHTAGHIRETHRQGICHDDVRHGRSMVVVGDGIGDFTANLNHIDGLAVLGDAYRLLDGNRLRFTGLFVGDGVAAIVFLLDGNLVGDVADGQLTIINAFLCYGVLHRGTVPRESRYRSRFLQRIRRKLHGVFLFGLTIHTGDVHRHGCGRGNRFPIRILPHLRDRNIGGEDVGKCLVDGRNRVVDIVNIVRNGFRDHILQLVSVEIVLRKQ